MGGEEGKGGVAHVGLHPSVAWGYPGEKLPSPALRNKPRVQRLDVPKELLQGSMSPPAACTQPRTNTCT